LTVTQQQVHNSPYGEPSSPLVFGRLYDHDVVFLPRHGLGHTIPPHKINYQANLFVLHKLGIETIVAVNAVGGISAEMIPEVIVIPDQIIDYTYSRAHTYSDGNGQPVKHVDFTQPYCRSLRAAIIKAAETASIDIISHATYAATQGPRLESAAEIDRLERDGCHIVGMTGMPEAALARELGLCYASISIVVNEGAGRGKDEITMEEIGKNLNKGVDKVKRILEALIGTV